MEMERAAAAAAAAAAAGGRELMLPLTDASDEDAKRSRGGGGGTSLTPSLSGLRKPRGRPKGSKNKRKPPVVITREISYAAMRPAILELPAGCDILASVAAFSRRRGLGVSLLSASGAVHNPSLRHPPSRCSSTTVSSFPGRFEILSLSGTFLPPEISPTAGPVTLTVAGGMQGQVIGGAVAGPLTAAGAVVLLVATFTSPEFYRLPIPTEGEEDHEEEEEEVKAEVSGGGGGGYVTSTSAGIVNLWGSPRAPGPHSHRPPPPHDHHY